MSVSSSGQYQTAAVNGGGIYTSSDYGSTWSASTASTTTWQSVSVSSSGQYQTAVYFGSGSSGIYTSSDYGSTWTASTGAPNNPWQSVSVSSSGQYQTVAAINSTIHTSICGPPQSTNISCNIISCNTVTATGGITALSFTSTSDYRIKENVVSLNDTYIVDGLNPVKYFNKLSKKEDIGLIAHELGEIYPILVNGEKDGSETQSVNYTGLIPILIKEIKELKNRVKYLEENK